MVTMIAAGADPDKLIRKEWGDNLAEHLASMGVPRKELQRRLALIGIDVTHQAIGLWIAGAGAPRPHVQAAIAHVLNVPGRSLFPLTYRVAA